jgi:hypothetical protein
MPSALIELRCEAERVLEERIEATFLDHDGQ